MTDKCAKCGHPRKEHSYNGACYGLCGEFVECSSAGSADALELARHIEQSTPPTYMDDVLLDRADREIVVKALRHWAGATNAFSRDDAQSSADPAVLRDALKNMMGAYDTPLSRRRFPPDEFMQAALESGRAALAAQPPAAPVETNADLPTHNDVRGILPPSSAGTAKALDDLEIFIGEVDGSEAAEGGTIDGTEAIEALNALRAAFAQPQPSAGCGDPGCTDPNCDYGKGPLRCQSCGAPIVDEPQTLSTPEGGK
jgi:hypothetical protein